MYEFLIIFMLLFVNNYLMNVQKVVYNGNHVRLLLSFVTYISNYLDYFHVILITYY